MGESGGTAEILNDAKTDQYTLTLGHQPEPQKGLLERVHNKENNQLFARKSSQPIEIKSNNQKH